MATISTTANSRHANSSVRMPRAVYSRAYSYASNVYFEDGKLLTGILTCLLYLILGVSLDAAGYVQSMSLLIPVTLGAFALGTMMAFSRFDGFFALSHSMFTGLAWILFLMTNLVKEEEVGAIVDKGIPLFQAKVYFILIEWITWLEAAFSNQASANNYVFIFEIAFLLWMMTYLGVWAIFRHGYTWRAVVPASIVLLINTYYAPNSILGFLVVFSLLALVLLVRTNLAEQQRRWRERRIHFNQEIGLDFLRNGFMFSVVVIALAGLAPSFGRSFIVRQVMAPINEAWQDTNETLNNMYSDLNRRTTPAGSAFGRKLSLGGARNVSNRNVFQVQTSQGRYWRAVTFDMFDGREWHNTSEETEQFAETSVIPVANWALREPLTQTVTLYSSTGGVIFGAPDIYWSDVPITARYETIDGANPLFATGTDAAEGADAENSVVEMVMAHANRTLEPGDSYTVLSRQTVATQRALESASTVYSDAMKQKYLQLPESFSARVAALAEGETIGAETVYGKAKAIERFLRNYEYNEEIAAPPEGVDPVEYFLFDIQEGYCDYYATSMVLMLRHLGIPARTASGYAEGTLDEESGVFIITERDAHTWVEVFFPGFGWIEFEPTAAESPLNRPLGEAPNESGPIPGMPLDESGMQQPYDMSAEEQMMMDLNNSSLPEDIELAANSTTLASQRTWWFGGIFTVLAVLAGLFFMFRTKILGPTSFTPDVPPLLYDRMQRWATRLGLRLPDSRTPYERARQLGRSLPEGRTSIDRITDSYVLYQFSRKGRGDAGDNPPGNAMEGAMQSPIPLRMQVELPRAWQSLHGLFWRAWFRNLFNKVVRRGRDPFALLD